MINNIIFEFPKSRKARHANYVGTRIYDITHEIRSLALRLDKLDQMEEYSEAKNKDKAILKDIRFKLSLMRKYQRYLKAVRL